MAVWTAGRRNRTWWRAATPIGAGVVPVVGLPLLTGLVPVRGLALIPVAGILVGGALGPTVLGGRRAAGAGRARDPVGRGGAGTALGRPDRDARLEIARLRRAPAGAGPDPDRGLVTLPGAFAGVLLGGASPVEASAVQLFVLVALMAVAVALALELVARGWMHRDRGGRVGVAG
ncbi:ABC transporter permease [Streptomyces sp. NBC_01102]|uniref:ABC transporter permease n=1 Tax=Streptomyces sp. NBC_01102 TaxID=2903749 RepID=UPI003866F985|nr:ABC transporter permease [Streptomyces sp. NBC_01102]